MLGSEKITRLLEWCESNGFRIDRRLVLEQGEYGGISVYSGDFYISPFETLVHIPKDAVLSVKSCSLSDSISPIPYGHGAQFALSLALYVEQSIGSSSRWFGYLQSLPDGIIDLPVFWDLGSNNHIKDQDGGEGLRWLRGTEVEKQLRMPSNTAVKIRDELQQYYHDVVEPFFAGTVMSTSTWRDFCRAYSLVSSRAFLVDAYHGLAMVPIADAFNHVQDNQVHLESDYNVCPHCGSLHECSHDRDDNDVDLPATASIQTYKETNTSSSTANKDLDHFYEMVSNAPITPRTEVFNTYGETLNNSQLLAQYGFILDMNDHDCLTWEVDDLCHNLDVLGSAQLKKAWNEILDSHDHDFESFSTSLSVYHGPADTSSMLCLNGDGKITHQLWLFFALLSLKASDSGENILEQVRQLRDLQLSLENKIEGDEDDEDVPSFEDNDISDGVIQPIAPMVSLIADIARLIITLCVSRKQQMGGDIDGGTTVHDLGHRLDNLPENMIRTRMALTLVMNEHSILDSCQSTWEEILAVASPRTI